MIMLFAHYAVAEIAPQAEKLAGMPSDRVILFRGGSEIIQRHITRAHK